MPSQWKRSESIRVGGLTCVGFGHAEGEELLFVVSHDGRGVFALDGTRDGWALSARPTTGSS
jgi:hypothetical protein